MSIQQAGGTTVNNTLSLANGITGCIYSQAAQSFNSAFNDIKNQLVAAGWTAVLKTTGVTVNWTSIPATGSAITVDSVTYTYRTALSATTTLATTLSTTTGVTVVPTSGTNIVTGSIIQIDSEYMYVVGGGGTAELTVVRGYGGSTPATHTSGATLYIGCEVLIGANTTATATNLYLAITAGSGIGTNYSNGTKAHHSLTAINPVAAWVNIYTKDAGTQTVGKFSASNTGTTNSTIAGYNSGTTSYLGGWWLYPARTPVGLHGRIALTDNNVAATTGSLGGFAISASSADGVISPVAVSNGAAGVTISINTSGVYTVSGTVLGTNTSSFRVGTEIIVFSTSPAQVFTISSITSTTTGTVSVAPPVAINSASFYYNSNITSISFTIPDQSGASNLAKIYANKYQFVLYRPNDATYGCSLLAAPYVSANDAPYKITNIAASPATGTRFTTSGSHGLATGDSVIILEPKIGGNYTYFCTNTVYSVTAIDSTNFDITNVNYPGGTYTYDANNYAIMSPVYPSTKAKICRAVYLNDFTYVTTANPARGIRQPIVSSLNYRNTESIILNINSLVTTSNPTSFASSICFYFPLMPSIGSIVTVNQSYFLSDSLFSLTTTTNQTIGTSTGFIPIGQYWDSFIAPRNAALDSQIVYNGRIWQNFANGSQASGSFWIAVN